LVWERSLPARYPVRGLLARRASPPARCPAGGLRDRGQARGAQGRGAGRSASRSLPGRRRPWACERAASPAWGGGRWRCAPRRV